MNASTLGRPRCPRALRLLIAAVAMPLLAAAQGGTPAGAQDAALNHFIGANRCKNCHQAADSGDQFGRWQQEKHSKAFEELASDKAKEYGKARGVAEPQSDPKCLKCHVTAYERPKEELHRSFDPKLGVQCETCHGPGEKHMRARMTAAMKADAANKPAYTPVTDDEILRAPTRDTCVRCHNEESPGYKPFCFHHFEAQIRHVNPKKPRTDAERAALDACHCDDKCVCNKDGKCAGEKPKPADAAPGKGDEGKKDGNKDGK